MRLGERLLELGKIQRATLRLALEAQHVQGGRLGTTLVQQGHLRLDALADLLGAHLGVPIAREPHFAAASPALLAQIPAELAGECGAVPLLDLPAGLVVGMMDPHDARLRGLLERELRGPVEAWVAPELRVRYWLEKHYFLSRPAQFLRTDAGGPQGSPRRIITPSPAPLPGEARALGRIATVKRAVRAPRAEPVDELGLDITVDARRRSPQAERALARIAAAASSDALGDALCEHMAGAVACGLLFQVRGEVAIGWRAAHERHAAIVKRLAVPLDLPTAFRAVCESGATYRGVPPEAGRGWHTRLSELTGHPLPSDLILCPIIPEDRVLALLYAHSQDGGPIPAQTSSDLEALAEAVSERVSARASAAT